MGYAADFVAGDGMALLAQAGQRSPCRMRQPASSHDQLGKAGTTALTITRSGANVVITWPNGTTLQQASAVGGPYTDVPGPPANPLSVLPSGAKYYRWRL